MRRPPESFKALANRLAKAVLSKENCEFMRLLQMSGLLNHRSGASLPVFPNNSIEQPRRNHDVAPVATNSNRVGIWERRQENSQCHFARRMDMHHEWSLWANVGRIHPKGSKLRVLLIGESAARGYFYDPQFTPAMVLERVLQSRLGEHAVEVIDLARTGLGMEVRELSISALLLEPDAVVIFAGNNWHGFNIAMGLLRNARSSHHLGFQEISVIGHVDNALRERGVPGLKQFAENELAELVRQLVRDVRSAYEGKGVPLVWVIPEFNLVDWKDPARNAPFLPEGANEEWIILRQQAEESLRNGDSNEALEMARRMIDLDESTSPTGLYILAHCSQLSGHADDARRYLESARDASVWDPSPYFLPRVYSTTQQTLRREAHEGQTRIVDLPKIFNEHLSGAIADRQLFLDYCHLTSEGIRISMAATASSLLEVLKREKVPWNLLVGDCCAPPPALDAEAAFLAAVHNAHFGQCYEVIHYHCLRAVQLSPQIAEVMLTFADAQAQHSTTPMSRSMEKIAKLASPSIRKYLLAHNERKLDRILLDAIVDSLRSRGIDYRNQLDQLWREKHSVARGAVNLLDSYYCSSSLQEKETLWVSPAETVPEDFLSDYYKAYWMESRFMFVGEETCTTQLSITCRLSEERPSTEIMSIHINETCVAQIAIRHKWGTWDISVMEGVVRNGINEVIVRWPMPVFPGLKPLETVAGDLLNGLCPEFFHVFGEIHAFTVSTTN